ncbi:MAG: hypothetical protein PUK81_09550 [Firmicutes bacterium]|nr:hypothetical protein [Bacillota bacterium]
MKPSIEVDIYSLDTSIASHCGIVVSNGPEVPGKHEKCGDYDDPFTSGTATIMGGPYNVQFYEDTNCDCYTTGGDYGYWTS